MALLCQPLVGWGDAHGKSVFPALFPCFQRCMCVCRGWSWRAFKYFAPWPFRDEGPGIAQVGAPIFSICDLEAGPTLNYKVC